MVEVLPKITTASLGWELPLIRKDSTLYLGNAYIVIDAFLQYGHCDIGHKIGNNVM